MKKKKEKNCLLIFLILIMTILIGCIDVDTNSHVKNHFGNENVFFVSLDGSKDYKNIQDAIDAAESNYTIYVYNGHYIENISITKPINLIGENPDSTIIDGNRFDDVVIIKSDNVTVTNFTIMNSGKNSIDAGVRVYSNNNTIYHNIITDNLCGIYAILSENNKIHNNTIKSNYEYGIFGYSSNYMKIIDNLFFLNECCLRIQGSRYCQVIRNQFNDSNKGMYFCCGAMSNIAYHNSFINNELWNADDQVSGNEWSNHLLMEGNYWDDYDGVDKNNDGIGDTPYNITSEEKQDLFPLINPFISI